MKKIKENALAFTVTALVTWGAAWIGDMIASHTVIYLPCQKTCHDLNWRGLAAMVLIGMCAYGGWWVLLKYLENFAEQIKNTKNEKTLDGRTTGENPEVGQREE